MASVDGLTNPTRSFPAMTRLVQSDRTFSILHALLRQSFTQWSVVFLKIEVNARQTESKSIRKTFAHFYEQRCQIHRKLALTCLRLSCLVSKQNSTVIARDSFKHSLQTFSDIINLEVKNSLIAVRTAMILSLLIVTASVRDLLRVMLCAYYASSCLFNLWIWRVLTPKRVLNLLVARCTRFFFFFQKGGAGGRIRTQICCACFMCAFHRGFRCRLPLKES